MKESGLDKKMFLAALAISLVSIALIYSAKHYSPSAAERTLFIKQAIWVGLGLLMFWLVYKFPLRLHEILAYPYYLVGVLSLVALIFVGSSVYGSTRWYNLGVFNVQPSELMKIVLVIALARFLAYPKRITTNFIWVVVAVLMTLVPVMLVLKQPDLGTSIILLSIMLGMLFWSGLSIYMIALLITPVMSLLLAYHWITWGLFFVSLIVGMFFLRPGRWLGSLVILGNLFAGIVTPILWHQLHDYQKERIMSFLNPNLDPLGAGYQLIQSKVAIGSGGFLGKGYLNSSQARLDFLPMQHTDFVFSVLGEEFGLLGCLLILFLMGYLFYRGIMLAKKSRNNFSSLLACGIISILMVQVFVNVGMTVGLLPVTGIPLPLMSYGGSAMLVNWCMLGLLLNINAHWQDY